VLAYKQWDSMNAAGKEFFKRASVTTGVSAAENPITSTANAATPDANGTSDDSASASKADDAVSADPEPVPTTSSDSKSSGETSSDSDESSKSAEADNSKPESKAATKAAAAAAPVYDNSAVDLAQKYLQGRGVAQDCNRGVSLLKSSAAQPNPAAQIKLGALYASGYCVTQDRAEAYRWFAEAKQLQPGNQWIERNLNSLWSDMSASERARAQR
ncbi:MAG TPA: hypothetical protein VM056_00880, partial [Terriglobales bacterium]|nr:hypothetical protein [Terriglobales bacterium]